MTRKIISILILAVLFLAAGAPLLSKKIAELPEVMTPGSIHILSDHMYIVDGFSIQVYSLSDLKPVKKFLSKGEGPGQVKTSPDMSILTDKIVINSLWKMLVFSPMGELVSEKKVPIDTDNIYPVGNHFVGSKIVLDFRKFNHVQYINLYDKDFKVISQLFKGSIGEYVAYYSGDPSRKQKIEMVRDTVRPFVFKDKIFIADTSKGFFFHVFDNSGKKLYDIDVPYEKHKVTEAYKEKVLKDIKDTPNRSQVDFVFRDYFPAFKHVRFTDDKIYLVSHPWRDERCDLTVIDLKGKILKKAVVPVTSLFTVDKDRFYYLVENTDETWELHMEKL